jgi:hypothetical protein
MKYLILIFLFTVSAIGQDLTMELNTKDKLECVRVIDSLDLSRSEIYEKTLEWVTITYQNSESVNLSDVKDQMIRIKKASSEPMDIIFNWRIGYTIQIDIKDNKLRLKISDIELINLKNYSYPMEIIVKNGKFRSGVESVNYRKGANEEFSSIYRSYLEALSGEVKLNDVW